MLASSLFRAHGARNSGPRPTLGTRPGTEPGTRPGPREPRRQPRPAGAPAGLRGIPRSPQGPAAPATVENEEA